MRAFARWLTPFSPKPAAPSIANTMKTVLSSQHRQRFAEIRKNLDAIGSHEGAFVKIELLFFEALNLARQYGDALDENALLAELKRLHGEPYEKIQGHFKKRSQKELRIRQFIAAFKRVISGKTSAIADAALV